MLCLPLWIWMTSLRMIILSSMPLPENFNFTEELCFIGNMYHIFIIHSRIDVRGHLGCFPFLAFVNKATVNMNKQVLL